MRTCNIEDTLPNKPSALIRVAMADLNKVERDKRYAVDMGTWHDSQYIYNEQISICEVCLAGSVMAKSLNAELNQNILPTHYRKSLKSKLLALDDFRTGDIHSALYLLKEELPKKMKFFRNVESYDSNRRKFKIQMHKIARDLERHGL